jgi:hypothetical protein
MTPADGSGFFDVIGSPANMTLDTAFTVTGLVYGNTYRFRYQVINAVGASGWSPVAYL